MIYLISGLIPVGVSVLGGETKGINTPTNEKSKFSSETFLNRHTPQELQLCPLKFAINCLDYF